MTTGPLRGLSFQTVGGTAYCLVYLTPDGVPGFAWSHELREMVAGCAVTGVYRLRPDPNNATAWQPEYVERWPGHSLAQMADHIGPPSGDLPSSDAPRGAPGTSRRAIRPS